MRALLIGLVLLLLVPCRVLAQPSPASARAGADASAGARRARCVERPEEARRGRPRRWRRSPGRSRHRQPSPPRRPTGPDRRRSHPARRGRRPAPGAKPPPAAPEQKTLPLAPNSLGAQVLLRGENILGRVSTETTDALHAMRSLPLSGAGSWSWRPTLGARHPDRCDLAGRRRARLCLAAEYLLRRAGAAGRSGCWRRRTPPGDRGAYRCPHRCQETPARSRGLCGERPRRPSCQPHRKSARKSPEGNRRGSCARKPTRKPLEADEEAAGQPGTNRAGRQPGGARRSGDIEPPVRRPRHRIPAWVLLRRVPLVLARLLLDLVPVLGFVLVGHLVAGSAVGGQASTRLVLLAVVDSLRDLRDGALRRAHAAVAARPAAAPAASARQGGRLPAALDPPPRCRSRWSATRSREVGLLLGLSDVAHDGAAEGHRLRAARLPRHHRAAEAARGAASAARAARRHRRHRPSAQCAGLRLALDRAVLHRGNLAASGRSKFPTASPACCTSSSSPALLLIGARLLLIVLDGVARPRAERPARDRRALPRAGGAAAAVSPRPQRLLRGVVYVLCVLASAAALRLGRASPGSSRASWATASSPRSAPWWSRCCSHCAAWEAANAAIQRQLAKLAKDQQVARPRGCARCCRCCARRC